MKKLIFIPLLLLTVICFGQSSSITSPMGNIISICPGTTITQTSGATTFFSETLPAGSFVPNKWYHLRMEFKLTTPVVSIPGITVSFQLGSQTFTLMSSAALVGGQTNGLFGIEFYMIAQTATSQVCYANITQPNGSLITLGSAVTPVGSFTANSAVANNFAVNIQFTGTSLGASSLQNFWVWRDAFN